jgi:hypothetical protein
MLYHISIHKKDSPNHVENEEYRRNTVMGASNQKIFFIATKIQLQTENKYLFLQKITTK